MNRNEAGTLPYAAALPRSWSAVPLKYLATLTNGYVFKSDDWTESGTPIVRIENLNGSSDFNRSSLELSERYRVNPGDLLYSWSGNPGTSFGPYRWNRPGTYFLNQHIFKVCTHGCTINWLYWSLLAATHWVERELTSGMIGMVHVTKEELGRIPIPIPPFEEQQRIAEFLDAETARIDRTTSLRRRQIELMEAREISRIFGAVRGKEIAGERISVGLDWLGATPASWPVAPVSTQFDVQLGKMLNQDRTYGRHLKPYLRVLNVQWDRIDTTNLVEMDFPPHERRRYEVLPGDLLICEGGSYPGRAAIWYGHIPEIYYQKALHRARSRGRSSERWLYYCLRLARAMSVFEAEGNSTTMTHLTGEQLAARRFPFPDRPVQDSLVRNLDSASADDQAFVSAAKEQLSLLAERKQALITAAVTGQIDVSTASGRGLG